jgi:hypothetical protein
MPRHRASLITVLGLWAVIAAVVLRHPHGNIISWDTFGYHLYLPATFIHGDPGISDPEWVRAANDTYKSTGTLYQVSELPNGRWVNKYPLGLAMLWSPFFAIGHVAAAVTDAPQDGFSKPYQWSLIIAALVYALIGLLLLRKVLLRFFSERVAIGSLVLIVVGTNYFHQATQGLGMPHVFLFALGAAVLWRTIQWRACGRLHDAALLGFLLGLMVAARPSEIVWALLPLLAGLREAGSWRAYMQRQWAQRNHFLLMALVALLVCLPQLAYWKWMTGHWLYMSYNNPGEGFEFLHPYTWEALFSFRKGWLIYTPVMAIALAGLLPLWRSGHFWRWALIAFLAINLWIVTSWSCWWYADSFGQRALVQSYPVMAVLLGAALQWMSERRMRTLWGVPLLLMLIALNLFQTWQVNNGIIHTSRMTWPAYRSAFLASAKPQGMDDLLLIDRNYSGEQALPEPSRYHRQALATMPLNESDQEEGLLLSRQRDFSPTWRERWSRLTDRDHIWLEVSCRFQRPADGSVPEASLVAAFEHSGHSYGYRAQDVDLSATEPGAWTTARLWLLSPEVRRPEDPFITYCWLRDTLPVRVADLTVHAHAPKR